MSGKTIFSSVLLLSIGVVIGFFLQGKLAAQQIPTGNSGSKALSAFPSGSLSSGQNLSSTASALSSGNLPVGQSLPATAPSLPLGSTTAFSQMSSSENQNQSVPPANLEDSQIPQHILPDGGRDDIVQVGHMLVSQPEAYTGDDVAFTVTIENVAPYKKFIRQLCFSSNEGNFGCSPGFNLNPGQVFSISNSGRFTSSGVKNVGITWTQDGTNFYSPVNGSSATITIL